MWLKCVFLGSSFNGNMERLWICGNLSLMDFTITMKLLVSSNTFKFSWKDSWRMKLSRVRELRITSSNDALFVIFFKFQSSEVSIFNSLTYISISIGSSANLILFLVEDKTRDRRKARQLRDHENEAITNDMLVEILQESIRVISQFIRADKVHNPTATLKRPKKFQVELQDPTDMQLLTEIQVDLQKVRFCFS